MDDHAWMPPDPDRPPTPPTEAAPRLPDAPPPMAPPVTQPLPSADATIVEPVEPASIARPRRSKLLVGGAVVAVLAVGAAGVFAVSQFTGASKGGAASPTELGDALLSAIENEDALGVIDTLVPGERDVLGDPAIELFSELTRLGVLSPDADLAKIGGIEIELEGESVTAESTNVDDIVNLDLHAEATVTVDGSVVPIGDLVTDNLDPADVAELRDARQTQTEPLDVELTAVEYDGRWYFSVFHTVAEQLRAEVADSPPIPLEGLGSAGADTPEAAVDQILDEIVSLDLAGVIQSLNPGEAAALQRYAPLFVDDAQELIDEVPLEMSVTTRDFRVEGDGDRRTVFVDGLGVEGAVDLDDEQLSFAFSFEGDCVHAEYGEEVYDECVDSFTEQPEYTEALAETPHVAEFVDAMQQAFADMPPSGIELREFEGEWYVSPLTTSSEFVLNFLRALDRDELDELITLGKAATTEYFDTVLGGLFGLEDEVFGNDMPFDDDDSASESDLSSSDDGSLDDTYLDESYADQTASDSYSEDSSYVAPAWDQCYAETSAVDAAACFQKYVDSGELDAATVPVDLRFPECGYAELRWSSELYSLPDAEFIAAAEAARPCFLALVASGEVSEYELPYEITDLECFEGRNWYNTFDDSAYDDRYWECVGADN